MQAAAVTLEPGAIVADRYRILRLLGHGGMGVVYEAEHETLGRRVALKMLLDGVTKDPRVVARFFQEARSAASIGHPGIVDVFDLSREGEPAFLVMELLDGEELADRIASRHPLPIAEVLDIGTQLAEAVGAAHAHGIVHRDLKPQNVFIARQGARECVKVLDFGIAKLAGGERADSPVTKTGEVFGTPAYMAPEQMRGTRDVDHRADLWAIGAILFEALSGRAAFQGETVPELVLQIVSDPTPDLASLRPDCPPALVELVEHCMHKDPAERPGSAEELAAALRAARADAGADGVAPEPSAPSSTKASPHAATVSAVAVAPRPSRGRGPIVAFLGLATLVVGCAAAGLAGYWLTRPTPATDASGPSERERRAYREERVAPLFEEVDGELRSLLEDYEAEGDPSPQERARAREALHLYLVLTLPAGEGEPPKDDLDNVLVLHRRTTDPSGEGIAADLAQLRGGSEDATLSDLGAMALAGRIRRRSARDYLEQLEAGHGDLGFDRDPDRVRRVRDVLGRSEGAVVALSTLIGRTAEFDRPLSELVGGPPSPLSVPEGTVVRGAFTREGFEYVAPQLERDTTHHRTRWVLGLTDPITDQDLRAVRNRYVEAYIREWLQMLRAIRVDTPTDRAGIAVMLGSLTRGEPPLMNRLIAAVRRHTELPVPLTPDGEAPVDAWHLGAREGDELPVARFVDSLYCETNDCPEADYTVGHIRSAFEGLTRIDDAPSGEEASLLELHQAHLRELHVILLRRLEDPRASRQEDQRELEDARTELRAAIERLEIGWRPRVDALLWPPVHAATQTLDERRSGGRAEWPR